MKPLEYIIDIVIAVIILFLFPVLYFGQKQDALTRTVISTKTKEIVDEVRSKGYITREMYDGYLEELSDTGLLYHISMEQRQLMNEPEYRLRTPEEVIEEQNTAYTGSNIYTYHPLSTQAPIVTDPVNTGSLNTETNESILASAISTPASAGHTHTEACYNGHLHAGAPVAYEQHQHTTSCTQYTQSYLYEYKCNSCGENYYYMRATYYWDASTNRSVLGSSVLTPAQCPNCNSLSSTYIGVYYGYGYSCCYDINSDGDAFGLNDAVGYSVPFTYPTSAPRNTEKATYVNGCYSYHVHGILKNYPEGVTSKTTDMYNNDAYKYNPLYELYVGGGPSNYCYVPKYYSISWNGNYVGYMLTINQDGSYIFTLDSYGYPYYASHATYPATMTLRELYMYTYVSSFNDLVERATGWRDTEPDSKHLSVTVSGSIDTCNLTGSSWYVTCGKVQDGSITCNQIVTSISPTHPVQTVYTNAPLITTVIATYADGSTNVVTCTTTFSTSSRVQNQPVTLTYSYNIAGVSYTKSCPIVVSVVPRSKTCINGHTYNLNIDGSDPMCPYCRAWLKSLEIEIPFSESITIFKGTTLSENGVTLLATYLDGRKEHLDTEYVDNLDKNYVGTQNATLSYKGHNINLIVITKRNLKRCPICGRYYELYPDSSDPGCPYCQSKTPIFTGNILNYNDEKYAEDILKELYEGSGTYYFSRKDYFLISMENKSKSFGEGILSAIYLGLAENTIQTSYGGYIREDAR